MSNYADTLRALATRLSGTLPQEYLDAVRLAIQGDVDAVTWGVLRDLLIEDAAPGSAQCGVLIQGERDALVAVVNGRRAE